MFAEQFAPEREAPSDSGNPLTVAAPWSIICAIASTDPYTLASTGGDAHGCDHARE